MPQSLVGTRRIKQKFDWTKAFSSAFAVNNLGVTHKQLPLLFMVSGCSSLLIMPLAVRIADRRDKRTLYAIASASMMVVVVIYTNMSQIPLWLVMIAIVLMMMGILSRMVPAGALTTTIPNLPDRGAFRSINSSLPHIAGGVVAAAAGMIVQQKTEFSPLEHYNTVGYVMVCISLVSVLLLYRVSLMVKKKLGEKKV